MPSPTTSHPLDPLSPEEVKRAAAVCRAEAAAQSNANIRFNTISLQEPAKADLVKYNSDSSAKPPRLAFCILQFPPSPKVVEATVDVAGRRVVDWKEVKGVQPLASPDDCFQAEAIAKADAKVVQLLRERGITDLDLVACDPWSVQHEPVPGRLIQTWLYLRSSPDDNHYAHPLDFLPFVDLNLQKVVHIDLPYKIAPKIPDVDYNYHRNLVKEPLRADVKPLNVVQPDGPSFSVSGNLITWQKWTIRTSFNYREGLVLHDVRYQDGEQLRPVLWRASLVEMAVPYADVNDPFQRKCAFDVGDYGLGNCANSLELGCDCLGHIQYFDATLNNTKGEPVTIKKAVCLHEEDHGILWKHMEYRNSHSEVRRSRRLVLSFISTVVNYEYLFYWYFYQDGTIGYEIKLTGELSTNLLSPGEAEPEYGTLVMPGVNAQYHQHMFCARLDFAVDDEQGGKTLVVSEVNAEALPAGPGNPYGNGFIAKETVLKTESEAARTADAATGRYWKIKNPNKVNPVTGAPVAYKLMPQAQPTLLALPGSHVYKKGFFATKNLWVTPYNEDEKYPAGDYPLQSEGGEGIPKWVTKDRVVSGADPVVWYCFGVTHFPRVEDFPVMPVEMTGFVIKPFGFFNGNPGIDLPADPNAASKLCNGCANGHAANGH